MAVLQSVSTYNGDESAVQKRTGSRWTIEEKMRQVVAVNEAGQDR
jgi:hypothetical protein